MTEKARGGVGGEFQFCGVAYLRGICVNCVNSRVPFACLFRQPCRNVCTRINKRMERKTAVYQHARRCSALCVGVRNAGHTVRCGAINTSVTPITQRVDRDVLSRENRNYPPLLLLFLSSSSTASLCLSFSGSRVPEPFTLHFRPQLHRNFG